MYSISCRIVTNSFVSFVTGRIDNDILASINKSPSVWNEVPRICATVCATVVVCVHVGNRIVRSVPRIAQRRVTSMKAEIPSVDDPFDSFCARHGQALQRIPSAHCGDATRCHSMCSCMQHRYLSPAVVSRVLTHSTQRERDAKLPRLIAASLRRARNKIIQRGYAIDKYPKRGTHGNDVTLLSPLTGTSKERLLIIALDTTARVRARPFTRCSAFTYLGIDDSVVEHFFSTESFSFRSGNNWNSRTPFVASVWQIRRTTRGPTRSPTQQILAIATQLRRARSAESQSALSKRFATITCQRRICCQYLQ